MPNVSKSAEPRHVRLAVLLTFLIGLGLPAGMQAQAPATRPMVEVRTRLGTMVVALYNETPELRDRFMARVKAGEMDSLLLHRVVPGFAVEGGDPASRHAAAGVALGQDQDTIGLPLTVVPGLIHRKGALAAAPAGDTPGLGRRSHRDRFFFVLGGPYVGDELDRIATRNAALGSPFAYSTEDRRTYAAEGGQPRLDGSYTVFGQIVSGIDVLDAIAKEPCNTWDRPMEDIPMYMRILQ
ncbi:MAG: peptidylprolyl isomerase [Flavobacteriales bacterium]|nr:peptidylprolyl isomerase [Flavobacteriales bacterium]